MKTPSKVDSGQARISTGISGLDEVMFGGLLPQRSYLIVGDAGCGKTLFGLQWLLAHKNKRSDRGIYITLAEPASDIVRNISAFNWDADKLDIIDLSPSEAPGKDGDYQIFMPHEVEQESTWKALLETVDQIRPKRLVIDSVTHLSYLSANEYQFRKRLQSLVTYLNRLGCTTVMIFDPAQLAREESVGLAVDVVIRLRRKISHGLAVGLRSVEIEKYRGSEFNSGLHPMIIAKDGITLFPHRVEELGGKDVGKYRISSGDKSLDEVIGGGLHSGTSVLLSGPAGTGKTTLALQFMTQAAALDYKSILYTFEESIELILGRAGRTGIPLAKCIKSGKAHIQSVNAMQFFPDQFLAMVRHKVEKEKVKLVVVDSLRGYELSMEEFGMAKAHIQNLVHYLNRLGVTTILVNEMENITGSALRATDARVSHVADTAVLMRYAEYNGEVIKVVSCLKNRSSNFSPEIRQLNITDSGVKAGKKLENMQGILTGVPRQAASGDL
ncbi:MAG: ATPase domain-containing protein [Pseudohongiellaceae bacterium]